MKTKRVHLRSFNPELRKKILERDGYHCVFFGRGEGDGTKLHVEHIRPKDLGGKASIQNGQTLCSQHIFLNRTFKRPETAKKMFVRLYNAAKTENNAEFLDFCRQILEVYERASTNRLPVW